MRSHIARCWPVGIPNVITHSDAMQKIASAQPAGYNHPPCPIRNDLPDTDALMSKSSRKPDLVAHYHPPPRSFRSTAVAGARVSSPVMWGLFGGGGVAGSFVGDTGSSSGMTV